MVKKTSVKKKKALKSAGTKKTAKAPKTTAKKPSIPKKKEKKIPAKTTKEKSKMTKKTSKSSSREKTIQKIKQDLMQQRDSLLKEAEETLNSLPSELNFPDMGDQATAETDRNFMLRLRERERMLLKKIEETIERIDNNDYGICEECGSEIETKRLEARPVTTYCIECKTRQEEEERIAEGG